MVGRILAVVVAVAMVAGAIQLRQRIDDGSDDDGSRAGRRTGPAEVVCTTEVATICEGVGRTAEAPASVPALAADSATTDIWLTAGPWGEVVDDARRRAGRPELFTNDDEVIARSPMVLVLHRTRGVELRGRCPQLSWRCVGDAAAGGVLVAAATTAEAEGVLVRAAAAAGYLGRADYDRNDLESDPALLGWLQGLDRSANAARQSGATDYGRFLQIPAAAGYITYDAVATTVPQGFEKLVLEPRATVDVVLSTRRETPKPLRNRLPTLFDAGWKRPDDPSVRGDDGLPSPGVLQALQEVIR